MDTNDLRILVGIAYGMELVRKKIAGNGRVELIANAEILRNYVIAELNICTPWTVLISQLAEVVKIYDESMKKD